MADRKIIHIDMDCFFAAVEMRDFPQYRDVPLAVGGSSKQRGVISTCNIAHDDVGTFSVTDGKSLSAMSTFNVGAGANGCL